MLVEVVKPHFLDYHIISVYGADGLYPEMRLVL